MISATTKCHQAKTNPRLVHTNRQGKQDHRGSDIMELNSPGFSGEKAVKGSVRTERDSQTDRREEERERETGSLLDNFK